MTQNVLWAWCSADRRQPHILPESVVETLHVQLPNDNDDTFTGSIIKPISLRVRLLDPSGIRASLNFTSRLREASDTSTYGIV